MRKFDEERAGTGTAEWAEVTENICRGCANNCLYCYAAHNANRFKMRDRSDWAREEFTKRAEIKTYPARDGVVMFPSSHDITPFNLEAYIRVALLILGKGNQLLIVTKPRLGCIKRLCEALACYKDRILFRFTIGTLDETVSKFWEPGAPLPGERLECITYAVSQFFRVSVSMEPMLEGAKGAMDLVETLMVYKGVESIWIGKMNKIRLRVSGAEPEIREAAGRVEHLQRDSEILRLVDALRDNSVIRWKDSIKEVVARNSRS